MIQCVIKEKLFRGSTLRSSEVSKVNNIQVIRSELLTEGWVLSDTGSKFRASLIEALSKKMGSVDELSQVPTSLLASSYYRGQPTVFSKARTKKFVESSAIQVIDAEVETDLEFWSREAVTTLVGEGAKLALVGPEELNELSAAVSLMIRVYPAIEKELKFVQQFVFFESDTWMASSQPHFLGAIFLNRRLLKDKMLLAETIVHELAHQEFFCLNIFDRVVQQSADQKVVFAPFQKRDRPTIGRVHAAHSLYRTCQFLKAAANEGLFLQEAKLLRETVATFSPGDLTEFGEFLVERCYSKIALIPEESKVS